MSRFFRSRYIVAVLVLIALGFAAKPALHYYHFMTTHVTTDDAYVDGTVDLISSRVTGTVNQVYVQDNWIVKAGDMLVSLDPTDFAVRVEQARANLNRARSMVDQEYAQLTEAEAGQHLAEAQLSQAETDYKRAKTLRTVGVVSQEFYDQSETAYRASEANLALAKQEVARSRAALGGADNVDHERYDQAIVRQAEAQLKAAELDLAYTNIRAPVSGVITRKTVHIGHRVQAGEPLMTIVPLDSLYVTANFKETRIFIPISPSRAMSIRSAWVPGRRFRCCRRKTRPATGLRWSSGFRSRSYLMRLSPPTGNCGWDFQSTLRSISAIRADR
jgi:membrane fusion protein (multidrug efflux system)